MDIRKQIAILKSDIERLECVRDAYTTSIDELLKSLHLMEYDYRNRRTGNDPLVTLRIGEGSNSPRPMGIMRYSQAVLSATQHTVQFGTVCENRQNDKYSINYGVDEKWAQFWYAMIDPIPLEDYPDNFEWEG